MKRIIFLFALLFANIANADSVSGLPIKSLQTSVASASLVLQSSQGWLTGLSVTSGASAGYVLVFDATSAPANGTVSPKFCYQIPATSTVGVSFIMSPVPFTNGIVVEFSTTGCFTATSSATAFISGQVQ